jgi:hypothetical protein
MLVMTVRCFLKAMKYGSKFTYQTVPRLLTIWMDMGEDARMLKTENFAKVCHEMSRSIPDIPAYKVRYSLYLLSGLIQIFNSGTLHSHKSHRA